MRGRVRGQESRRHDDVVVDERDDRSLRDRDPRIARGAAVGLGDERVAHRDIGTFAVARRDLARPVARAVIDDDDFKCGRTLLRRKRCERAFEKRGAIFGRDDYRDAWRRHEATAAVCGRASASSDCAMRSAAPTWCA